MRLSEPAPAKLNLALHIRGKLPDGRHALETLFAFCIDGDRLEAEEADDLSLKIIGRFATGLPIEDNLVLKAAAALRDEAGVEQGAHLILNKKLPIASGIGGGSAGSPSITRSIAPRRSCISRLSFSMCTGIIGIQCSGTELITS